MYVSLYVHSCLYQGVTVFRETVQHIEALLLPSTSHHTFGTGTLTAVGVFSTCLPVQALYCIYKFIL